MTSKSTRAIYSLGETSKTSLIFVKQRVLKVRVAILNTKITTQNGTFQRSRSTFSNYSRQKIFIFHFFCQKCLFLTFFLLLSYTVFFSPSVVWSLYLLPWWIKFEEYIKKTHFSGFSRFLYSFKGVFKIIMNLMLFLYKYKILRLWW